MNPNDDAARREAADEAWHLLARYVIDNRDTWRRAAMARTGLPFSKIRIVRRLAAGPMSLSQVADSAAMDRPAATVAVNDLEERGLVHRDIDPADRRSRLVTLTPAGRRIAQAIADVDDPAPDDFAALPPADVDALLHIARRLTGAR